MSNESSKQRQWEAATAWSWHSSWSWSIPFEALRHLVQNRSLWARTVDRNNLCSRFRPRVHIASSIRVVCGIRHMWSRSFGATHFRHPSSFPPCKLPVRNVDTYLWIHIFSHLLLFDCHCWEVRRGPLPQVEYYKSVVHFCIQCHRPCWVHRHRLHSRSLWVRTSCRNTICKTARRHVRSHWCCLTVSCNWHRRSTFCEMICPGRFFLRQSRHFSYIEGKFRALCNGQ